MRVKTDYIDYDKVDEKHARVWTDCSARRAADIGRESVPLISLFRS